MMSRGREDVLCEAGCLEEHRRQVLLNRASTHPVSTDYWM
jgi:hypothetical protein